MDTIDQIGGYWAHDEVSDKNFTEVVNELAEPLTANLSSFASSTELMWDVWSTTILSLGQSGQQTFFAACTGALTGFNEIQSLRYQVDGLVIGSEARRQQIKTFYFIPAQVGYVAIRAAKYALQKFAEYDWDNDSAEDQTTSLSGSSSSSVMSSNTASSTSSSTSARASATPSTYMLMTTRDTDLNSFQLLIKSLPDQGQGDQIVFPNVPCFSYVTNLTAADAAKIKQNPSVRFIYPHTVSSDDSTDFAVLPTPDLDKRVDADPYDIPNRPNSLQHLKLISAPLGAIPDDPTAMPNYAFDPQTRNRQ